MENARKAKVSMEQFYENLLIQDRDRTNRWRKLEISMEDMALVEEEVSAHGDRDGLGGAHGDRDSLGGAHRDRDSLGDSYVELFT